MHLTSPMDISVGYDKVIGTKTWQGAVDDLVAMVKQTKFQDTWEEAENEVAEAVEKAVPSYWDTTHSVVTDMRVGRGTAGRGSLSCTVAVIRNMAVWNVDFSEVTKDIRTWHQEKDRDEKERPDLSAISAWEALKGDSAHVEMYTNFEYFDGTTEKQMEEGSATRDLAEMMFRGIESYPVYIPVVTCQATSASYNDITASQWGASGQYLSCERYPEDLDGFDHVGGVTADMIMADVGQNPDGRSRHWLVTADRLTINGDGTFARTMQWTGLDEIEEKLYKTEGGGEE